MSWNKAPWMDCDDWNAGYRKGEHDETDEADTDFPEGWNTAAAIERRLAAQEVAP